MRRALTALAVLVVAATAVPAAFAHANLIRSTPGSGSVLARAPVEVRLFFDDTVRPVSGIEAIRNGGGSILGGRPHVASGSSRELVIPLQADLRTGDYTVRWRVGTDDGHVLSGVFAFAVGSGRAPPTPALHAGGGGPPAGDVLRRFLFYGGLLLAAGSIAFQLVVRRWEPRLAALLPLAGFGLALAGSQAVLSPSTRFERVNDYAALAAAVGIVTAGAALRRARLLVLCVPSALALVVAPALRGHALDPGHSRVLAVAADVVHVAAAAFWVGGLVQLAVLLPGLKRAERAAVVRRFSAGALAAVVVVVATGALRALGELSAVGQLWDTGYGRAILVKFALLAGLVALGWENRSRLASPRFGGEFLLLAGIVTAASFLTALRPGRQTAEAAGAQRVSSALRLPPEGAVVVAREAGELAVALAARPVGSRLELTASVVGPDRLGVNRLGVSFEARGDVVRARDCGGGCYRAVVEGRPARVGVRLPGSTVAFALPARLQQGGAIMARATRVFRGLRTLVLHERLASSPQNAISTVFRFAAPDRMAYRIRGGPAGIVIGATRWDQLGPGKPWVRSDQDPLREPDPFWTSVSNAYVLRTTGNAWVVSFLDRKIPAWFTVTIDRGSYRTGTLEMTAAAHFMRHRYGPFNAPVSIRPPR